MPIAFVGNEWWEKHAYHVQEEAEELIKNDFGDRMMVWSEMAKILIEKGVPAEYLRTCCIQSLGIFQDVLDLFNAEIRECLTSNTGFIMTIEEFDSYMQEVPQITVKDHRILNPDSPQKRAEIQNVLSGAWKD